MADRPQFDAELTEVWETLQLDETIDIGAPTETLRPPTRHPDVTASIDLRDLPQLTGGDTTEAMDELFLKEVLGRGGMGEVRLARQLPLARDVAVKSLRKHPNATDGDRAVELLLRESWVTGRLEHPNIVPVHTLGRNAEGEPLLVLKKIEGISWAELLRHPERSPRDFDTDRPLDWHLEILSEVCDAVHFAHSRGIIHRDIKPENVMIGAYGEIYLLDWGVAVSLEADEEARLPTVEEVTTPAGTPAYMAPEMVSAGGDDLCRQTDVFLLGATLHEILTGSPPNEGGTVYETMVNAHRASPAEFEDVHAELASICRRALEPEPADRFESAETLRKAIAHHIHHRESIEISDEAHERLADFRRALESDGSDAEVYEIFGECLFGFRQALRVSPDNEAAVDGLQEVLERMVERELERGAIEAASLLISDLPRENPELEERLDEVERDIASREEEYAELKRERHEEDLEVARHARSLTAIALGVIWGATIPAFPQVIALLGLTTSPATYLAYALPVGVFVALVGYHKKNRILQNRANRRIASTLGWMIAAGVCIRALGIPLELATPQIVSVEMAVYSACSGVLAITLDPRTVWAAAPGAIGTLLAALLPGSVYLIFGLACLTSMVGIAWAWWPSR